MKVELVSFAHSANGISLYVVPDAERALLKAMWKHGKLELTNGVADGSGQGFAITWKQRDNGDTP